MITIDIPDYLDGGRRQGHSEYLRLLIQPDAASIEAAERFGSDDGIPAEIHSRRVQAYQVGSAGPLVVDRAAVDDLAERVAPLVARIQAGHSVEWDGSHQAGRLTDDAATAADDLAAILAQADIADTTRGAWEAAEWLGDYDLAADADIAALAAELVATAASDGALIIGGVDEMTAALAERQAA